MSREGGSPVGDRVLAQLLTEMDGLEGSEGVAVIAATNRPDVLDAALTRPGRLDRAIYVPLPDLETRLALLGAELGRMPNAGLDVELLASETEGFSGAELVALCKEAAMAAIAQQVHLPLCNREDGGRREALTQVEEGRAAARVDQDHVAAAFARVVPRTPAALLAVYEAFAQRGP